MTKRKDLVDRVLKILEPHKSPSFEFNANTLQNIKIPELVEIIEFLEGNEFSVTPPRPKLPGSTSGGFAEYKNGISEFLPDGIPRTFHASAGYFEAVANFVEAKINEPYIPNFTI